MATNNAINNTSNPISTTAVTIDPGASGDSYVQYNINTTGKWRVGSDDSTSGDFYVLSQGSALGTNDTFVMTNVGELTMPLQPAFLTYVGTTITNVTGDATEYTIAWDTEVFDQSGDLSGSTFTAPITGKYVLGTCVTSGDLSASFTSSQLKINTSNRTYIGGVSSASVRNASNEYTTSNYILADMDASDTVTISLIWSGSTKTVDVLQGVTSYFSGYLAV